jgi:DNA-binding protein HU-beta
MKKQDIIHGISQQTGLPKNTAEEAFDATIAFLKDQLAAGETIPLGDLGRLSVHERAARKGRNPATGAEIEIAARKVVTFKTGKALNSALNP